VHHRPDRDRIAATRQPRSATPCGRPSSATSWSSARRPWIVGAPTDGRARRDRPGGDVRGLRADGQTSRPTAGTGPDGRCVTIVDGRRSICGHRDAPAWVSSCRDEVPTAGRDEPTAADRSASATRSTITPARARRGTPPMARGAVGASRGRSRFFRAALATSFGRGVRQGMLRTSRFRSACGA
jgi:hypothetical protein